MERTFRGNGKEMKESERNGKETGAKWKGIRKEMERTWTWIGHRKEWKGNGKGQAP